MSRPGFIIFHDMRRAVNRLNDEDAGQLFKALFLYSMTGTEPQNLARTSALLFDIMAEKIDEYATRYNDKSAKNSENGKKGAAKRWGKDSAPQPQPQTQPKPAPFAQPTAAEIFNYCVQKGYTNIDYYKFYNHYSAQNWTTPGGEPVRNWQKLLDSWARKEKNPPQPQTAPAEPLRPEIDLIKQAMSFVPEYKE